MDKYEFFSISCEIGSILVYTNSGICEQISFTEEFIPESDENIFTIQIREYLNGERKILDFSVKYSSGPIFTKIWNYLRENVSYGRIVTYSELAKACNTNPRVVGYAMASNPLPLYIPCHRVVGSKGIGGYSGKEHNIDGIKWKKYFLTLEGSL
ncbi:methylated-DNA--[protein]-cysteine S-methyltransferase [Fervidobacterium sp. 2310opik-2]|uniref:methylated-DNA--[protein]-cysteine S-methyltransferase n=1 Tax=Fervidobacterium sp. 2310opik-2 TaxID=1755815 RepID=UPI0013DE7CB4|nr:methylated-DNA--[protein]-cysteine S-methyltransferase [Fervidobacterium sp. 2310opik-2]KAF2961799.1 cysteine methyltransferase [Fervidobacterium sp. 2310opik-2]